MLQRLVVFITNVPRRKEYFVRMNSLADFGPAVAMGFGSLPLFQPELKNFRVMKRTQLKNFYVINQTQS